MLCLVESTPTLHGTNLSVLSFKPHLNGEFDSPKGRDGGWEL